jgi:hypothetical protein
LAWEALTVVHTVLVVPSSLSLLALTFFDLTLQVLKSQQGRDDRVRDLLSTIVDMLGFVKDVEGLKKMQKIEQTVSCMMEEIRDCAVFIQEYSGKGLFGEYCRTFVR